MISIFDLIYNRLHYFQNCIDIENQVKLEREKLTKDNNLTSLQIEKHLIDFTNRMQKLEPKFLKDYVCHSDISSELYWRQAEDGFCKELLINGKVVDVDSKFVYIDCGTLPYKERNIRVKGKIKYHFKISENEINKNSTIKLKVRVTEIGYMEANQNFRSYEWNRFLNSKEELIEVIGLGSKLNFFDIFFKNL